MINYKLIITEINTLAANNIQKWVMLKELLPSHDFKYLIKEKNDSMKPIEAIELLIIKNSVEYPYINEVKFFNIRQEALESVDSFYERLEQAIIKTHWVTAKANRHLCNVFKVNSRQAKKIPMQYWKSNDLNEILLVLNSLKLNEKSYLKLFIEKSNVKCFKCVKSGHIIKNCNQFDVKPMVRTISVDPSSEINVNMKVSYNDIIIMCKFIVDTGSNINCINFDTLKRFGLIKLTKSDVVINSADGSRMKVYGKIELRCSDRYIEFFVMDTINIIGCKDALNYKLIQV
ncbi:hypothetical protein A3Q56_08646, partial [Intoshia linei]